MGDLAERPESLGGGEAEPRLAVGVRTQESTLGTEKLCMGV